MNMDTWQLCPMCKGHKTISPRGISDHTQEKCTICNGHGIISSLTGLPPHGSKPEPFVPLDIDSFRGNRYTGGNYDIKQTFSGEDDPREGISC